MIDPRILDGLRRLPHFASLQGDLLERIAQASTLRSYAARDSIFRQGDTCRGFFAIASGGVRVYRSTPDGREQVLHRLPPGRSFAEPALLVMGHYPAHADATEDGTQLVEVGGRQFLELFRDDPRLSAAMVSSLCMRMLELVERIEELSVADAGARFARYLLRLPAHGAADSMRVTLPMAKKELAAHLAITPETVSRLLRRLHDRGVVRTDGRELSILDDQALMTIADGEE